MFDKTTFQHVTNFSQYIKNFKIWSKESTGVYNNVARDATSGAILVKVGMFHLLKH